MFLRWVKTGSLIGFLWLFVCITHRAIIHFDMMYYEQPIIYLLNQKIVSWGDLLHIYLHPQMLDGYYIPFFRPSGHFLIYQILTSFLDWHNTRGFLIVNFLFLALTGLIIIKLYRLLFPGFSVGGYIACGIYFMHPALMLSKLTSLHFEFACMFFSLLALYCLALFCQSYSKKMLSLSMLFFIISVTFKEVALMMGPVIFSYILIKVYYGNATNKRLLWQTASLFTILTFTLTLYMTQMWDGLSHPLQHPITAANLSPLINKFLKLLFALPFNFIPDILWDVVVFPNISRWMLWVLSCMLIISIVIVFSKKRSIEFSKYRQSIIFLFIAVIAFLILPILWGHGRAWHLAESLIFFSLLMGFGFEFLCRAVTQNTILITGLSASLFLLLGMISTAAANLNIAFINAHGFAERVDRNAVMQPPDIKNQLNATSVLVVEDSIIHNDYWLGDSIYSHEAQDKVDQQRLNSNTSFYQLSPNYGSTLFRWAYLMPKLKEQIYPFTITNMQTVPDATLNRWLKHYNNIFCVGYDKDAHWHDRTTLFKKNLLLEKKLRQAQR